MTSRIELNERIGILPIMKCSCGSNTPSDLEILKTYVVNGNKIGQELAKTFLEEREVLKKKKFSNLTEQNLAVRELEIKHKKMIGERLNDLFNELEIECSACRISIAERARQGIGIEDISMRRGPRTKPSKLDKVIFNPENYYVINKL